MSEGRLSVARENEWAEAPAGNHPETANPPHFGGSAVAVPSASFKETMGFAFAFGTLIGCLDAFMVQEKILGARGGIEFVPWTIWPAAILAWTVTCALASALLWVVPPLRRWAVTLLMAAVAMTLLTLRIILFRFHLMVHPKLLTGVVIVLGFLTLLALFVERSWRRGNGVRRLSRVLLFATVPAAVVSAVILATTAHAAPKPPAAVGGLPASGRNIVLIVLDTLRYDQSGIGDAGAAIAPNLHAFSMRGVRFQWAAAPAPWTLPSHVSIMTGLPEWELALNPEQQTVKQYAGTLPKRFARRGYDTAAFIANPILHDHTGFEAGFRTYDYPRRSLDFCRTAIGMVTAKLSSTRGVCAWTSADVSSRALAYIEQADRPYFLTLNYFDPHDPYWLPPNLDADGPRRLSMADHDALMRVLTRNVPLPSAERARILGLYAQAVHGMDASMKPLLDRLARDVDDGKTIVAIVSDHGEHFGEHNLCGHGNSVYAPLVRIPMMVRARGLSPKLVSTPVSATMLFNVLRRLALRKAERVETTASVVNVFAAMPAISHINFGDAVRGVTDFWSIAADGHHLVESDQGQELYDLMADPSDASDLVAAGTKPDEKLVNALRDARLKSGPRGPDPYEDLKGIGYLP